jgi:nucleotide-binding universal stress UspA family protein
MAIRPIVVGVDGSEESLQAVEWAAVEARRRATALRIVSAPMPTPWVRAYRASPEAVAVALRHLSGRALEAGLNRAEEVAPGLPVETEMLSGPPAVTVATAGAEGSMLVVGARGAGGFASMVLGSVSRYAATNASCPVVVARQQAMAAHREIAVGLRDGQDTTEALAFAFEEAALRGADLVAVHAWFWFPSALLMSARGGEPELRSLDTGEITAEADRVLAAALDEWRDKYPEVRIRRDVSHGHPARVLASYCARADLVVLGRHRADDTCRGAGSIQHAVLDHAHGPVAIVPAECAPA